MNKHGTYPHHSQSAKMHYGYSLGDHLEEAPEALNNVIQLIDACQSNTKSYRSLECRRLFDDDSDKKKM